MTDEIKPAGDPPEKKEETPVVTPEKKPEEKPENHAERRTKELVDLVKDKDKQIVEVSARVSGIEFERDLLKKSPNISDEKIAEYKTLREKHPTLDVGQLIALDRGMNPPKPGTGGVQHSPVAISPREKSFSEMDDAELLGAATEEAKSLGFN